MINQATIAREVKALGTGLHSGHLVHMTLKPAPPNSGVRFVRTDLAGVSIKACMENIDFSALQLATTLVANGAAVHTVEHLLSALYATEITNVIVELDGAEVPIMDGSAAPFLILLEEAGRKKQPVAVRLIRVLKPFSLTLGDKRVEIKPADELSISYEIDFDHPLIRRQMKTVSLSHAFYESQIAPARTFGFLRDVNYLKSQGLIKGGSLDNAIVLDGDRVLNESLRFPDEFVSHKILDLIGDFSVAGYCIQGHVTAFKAGHEIHAQFMRAFLAARDCYEIIRPSLDESAWTTPASPLTRPLANPI